EVTHEALLDAWPRLVGWRREDAEGARLRDQLRAAARQWTERNRPSGLLWRGDALDEYRIWRRRVPGGLTAAEEAFASASLAEAARGRRLRRVAFGAVFLALAAFAVVMLIQNARVERERERARSSAAEMHDLLRDQYEEQGRRLLLADDPLLALGYLHQASQLGAAGPAHDFLVAQAIRATDGELLELPHDGRVNAVRFAPDGERIVTAGADNRARLWDARGVRLADLPHAGEVFAIAWSQSGDRIATAGVDGAALWNRDGRLLHRLEHGAEVHGLAFAPDGATLLTATVTDEVTRWSAARGERLAVLRAGGPQQSPPVDGQLALSPDGAWIAAGDATGTVRLWDGPGGRLAAEWKAHSDQIRWLGFSPDGKRLVSSTIAPEPAVAWSVPGHQKLSSFRHEQAAVNAVSFSPDGERIATASTDRTGAIWKASDGSRESALRGHAAGLARATWSPDGLTLATAGEDGSVVVWDAPSGRRVARRVGHRGPIRDIAFEGKGRSMATASVDGRALVWTTEPQQRVTFLVGHGLASIWSTEFSPSGAHVLTACADQTARIWDAATGRELLTMQHPAPLAIARFSRDGLKLATGADDGAVRVWDARTGALLDTFTGHPAAVGAIGWDRSGARVVSGAVDGSIRVWSLADRKPLLELQGHDGKVVVFAEFHPSRRSIVTVGSDDQVIEWDAAGGGILARTGKHPRRRGQFDRTGRLLVSATSNRSAEIWQLDGGARVQELVGHVGTVRTAAFGRGDAFVVTASFDETARIWEREHGRLLAVLALPDSWVNAAAFSPDGTRVATVRGDGVGEIWQLPTLVEGGAPLDEVVRCRAPYHMSGHNLVLRPRLPGDCRLLRGDR
ncbi:MAG TPA: WD40 repeat domain-containing protein, partial [Kofleriaceae bacterium]|nr:WD40 repeat domain-containing protein [Kofleriaceae bacterium]